MYILMLIITFSSLGLIFAWELFSLKKKENNTLSIFNFSDRFYKLARIIFSTILLITYFIMRWINALINIINYDLFNTIASEFKSANISMFLMLDWCAMMGWLLPFLCIVDWKHKYVLKPVALLSLIGGLSTIVFGTPGLYQDWDIQKFFIGSWNIGASDGDGPLVFTMHLWMCIIGFYICNKNQYFNRVNHFITAGLIIGFITYILILANTLDIKTHVTGLVYGDIYKLEDSYYTFNGIIGNAKPSYGVMEVFGLEWYHCSLILWLGIITLVVISILLKNTTTYLITNKYLKYYLITY